MRHAGLTHLALFAAAFSLAMGQFCARAASASHEPAAYNLTIRAHGGYFVGGETVSATDANAGGEPGQFVRGAAYVEYTRLANRRFPLPVLMFPGGGFSGAAFQDRPDGRPGWEWSFLKRGFDVAIVDVDRTGRSPIRRYPDIDPAASVFRSNRFLWETFRIGRPGSYQSRTPYHDTRFPVAHFDQLAKQAAPRFRLSAPEQAREYDAVIGKACPCILLLHSAASGPGLLAAQRWPALVKAVVAVEPAAVPPRQAALPSRAPHIFLWGDHLSPADTDPDWSDEVHQSMAFAERLRRSGVPTVTIDLPRLGIRGNSHFPMLDDNSDAVAGIIARALEASVNGVTRNRKTPFQPRAAGTRRDR